jgi:hypothetical protein
LIFFVVEQHEYGHLPCGFDSVQRRFENFELLTFLFSCEKKKKKYSVRSRMSFSKRTIAGPLNYVSVADVQGDGATTVNGVSHGVMTGMIDQLGALFFYSREMFGDLLLDSASMSERTLQLSARVDALQAYMPQVEDYMAQSHVSGLLSTGSVAFQSEPVEEYQCFTAESRGAAVRDRMETAEAPPNLAALDQFMPNGAKCLQNYTHPDFFLEEWIAEMSRQHEEARRLRREMRKARGKRSGAADRTQKKVVKKIARRRDRMAGLGAEFVAQDGSTGGDGSSSSRRPSRAPAPMSRADTGFRGGNNAAAAPPPAPHDPSAATAAAAHAHAAAAPSAAAPSAAPAAAAAADIGAMPPVDIDSVGPPPPPSRAKSKRGKKEKEKKKKEKKKKEKKKPKPARRGKEAPPEPEPEPVPEPAAPEPPVAEPEPEPEPEQPAAAPIPAAPTAAAPPPPPAANDAAPPPPAPPAAPPPPPPPAAASPGSGKPQERSTLLSSIRTGKALRKAAPAADTAKKNEPSVAGAGFNVAKILSRRAAMEFSDSDDDSDSDGGGGGGGWDDY